MRYRDALDVQRAWGQLTGDLEPPRHPLDQAQDLIEEWARASDGKDLEIIRCLDALLGRHEEDELLYYDLLPSLPMKLVGRYCEHLPSLFSKTLSTYVNHVQGDLPWEYCDEAAAFYAAVFSASKDELTRSLALTELLKLGQTHKRYNVADIVRSLLWNVRDQQSVSLAAQVIKQTPHAAWYRHRNTFRKPLHTRIRAALQRAKP